MQVRMHDRIEDGSVCCLRMSLLQANVIVSEIALIRMDCCFGLLILGVLVSIDDDSSISAERVSLDPGINN